VGREGEDEREAECHKSGIQWRRTWQGKMRYSLHTSGYLYARSARVRRVDVDSTRLLRFLARKNGVTLT
jgi:hypothetical protein